MLEAQSLYKSGLRKIEVGKIFHDKYGVNQSTVYRYLNDDFGKYICYHDTYKELRKSELFLGFLVHSYIRIDNLNTGKISKLFGIPLNLINRNLTNFLDDHKTSPHVTHHSKSNDEKSSNERKEL